MEKTKNQAMMTGLIIAGLMISYIMQMGPSPLLLSLRDEFGLEGQDAVLNMCVSVIFPFLIAGSLAGSYIDRRIGTSRLFILTMSLLAVGIAGNFIVNDVAAFLVFRAIFGFGFGLGIPFIGSAIMKWYGPRKRDFMTTVNGLFPFVATLISFCMMSPLSRLLGNSWKAALGFWSIPLAVVLAAWLLFVHRPVKQRSCLEDNAPAEKGLYIGLLKRRAIRILTFVFLCDFFCYAYIATILPTWLFELGRVSEVTANILAAVAFPLLGLLGCVAGGIYSSRSGRRKPPLTIGQAVKLIGLILASMTANLWVATLGVSVYAFGNGLWMPSMYGIPTELAQMNATRVAAAFTLMSAFGFAVGFFSPIIGGYITVKIMELGEAAHVIGLRWSVFVFSFLNLAAFISAQKLAEPEKERK